MNRNLYIKACRNESFLYTNHRKNGLNCSIGTFPLSTATSSAERGPLSGIRILDMSRILAGPHATMVLADFGAEIIKLEPTTGDDTRSWGPPFTEKGKESTYFLSCNRNKKSIAVDLKKAEGKKIVYDLLPKVDVVVENLPTGKAELLGIGYGTLKALNPKIIYTSVSGFGHTGPYSGRLAYDTMVSAMGGMISITGPEDNVEYCKPGVALTDVICGLYAHGAIASALWHRERTGIGQRIDVSLFDTQVAALINVGSAYLNAGVQGKRWGTAHASIVPYQSFGTADGKQIVVGALNDRQFEALCAVVHHPEWAKDNKFQLNQDRVTHRKELIPLLQSCIALKPREEWVNILEAAHVPCGPVNSISDVFEDVHVQKEGLLIEADHPTADKVRWVRSPVKWSEFPQDLRDPPPLLGQHTREILTTLAGYSAEHVDHLIVNGVCK